MKEFFEEYGRVIVTVLIILGIVLVGYVIAGNGNNSAFGKFTADVVESLSGQANSLLADSPEAIERSVPMSEGKFGSFTNTGEVSVNTYLKDGTKYVVVSGKSDHDANKAFLFTHTDVEIPWGEKSVMSFDITADKNSAISIDLNAEVKGVPGNDTYSNGKGVLSVNGTKTTGIWGEANVKLTEGKQYHVVLIMENGNEQKNPSHKAMRPFNTIHILQDGGTTNYQIKNLKYGAA